MSEFLDLPEDITSDLYECDENKLAYLLFHEILFINTAKDPKTICLFVNCSDCFVWGSCDAEDIMSSELEDLWQCILKFGRLWGGCVWTCFKRNLQPQKAVKIELQKIGIWNSDIEMLRENPC